MNLPKPNGGIKWIDRLKHSADKLDKVEFVDLLDAYIAHLVDGPPDAHLDGGEGEAWIKHHQKLRDEIEQRTWSLR